MKKIVKILGIIVGIGLILFVGYKLFIEKEKEEIKITVIDKIEGYDYKLNDNTSELYKKEFNNLKTVLSQTIVNEKEYASTISKLYVIDFYSLSNKITNNDIGGYQFIHESARENFLLKAKDTIYKYVKSNIYGDRKQELPMVSNVEITDITNISYKYLDKTDKNAYQIKLNISYELDLGYQKEVTLIIVKESKFLKIVETK